METTMDFSATARAVDYALTFGPIEPRDYQLEAHFRTLEHVKDPKHGTEPAFVNASVGAGKTINIGMLAKHVSEKGGKVLVLARQGELIEQNAEDAWLMECKNSTFSASLGTSKKAPHFPVVMGTEGTVCRALDTRLADSVFDLLLIDECHMVDWEDVTSLTPTSQYAKIIHEMKRRNPKLRIIGYSGSVFRGTDPILGEFWKKELINIGTDYLCDRGFLVPQTFGFGHDDVGYGLEGFDPLSEEGTNDFTATQLKEMEKQILENPTATQKIMREVIERTKDRNGVLITCAGKKHCEEAARALPEGSFGIVTDSTKKAERRKILADAKVGKIKYVLQVGCLTTGVNVPPWDTIVILRRIGSLTLLIQLIGRGLRLLKEMHERELGMKKTDCLILDYSETMASMGELYHHPILEQADIEEAKQKKKPLVECPTCGTMNSSTARRCIGKKTHPFFTSLKYASPYLINQWLHDRKWRPLRKKDLLPQWVPDDRCENFYKSRVCEHCNCLNDTTARTCRQCKEFLIDPNEALNKNAYRDSDFIRVLSMGMVLTRDRKKIVVKYRLENGEKATEFFTLVGGQKFQYKLWKEFVDQHVFNGDLKANILKLYLPEQIMNFQAAFVAPKFITHRKNDGGYDIIRHKRFTEFDNVPA